MYSYKAHLKSDDLDDLNDYGEEIEEELLEIYFDAIDDIGEEGVYQHTIEAANILDEMAETIEELKAKLVEFEGHPIYTGDCPYLDEATM